MNHMPLKRWKSNKEGRERFLKRALKTRASMTDIGERAGLNANQVSAFNLHAGIRAPELAREIGRETRRKKMKQKRGRLKKSVFTEKQKLELIKRNRKEILKQARHSWRWEIIRKEYGNNFQDFLRDIETEVFNYLDSYDQKKFTKEGKPTKVSFWIGRGAYFACLAKLTTLIRRKSRQIPVDEEGRQLEFKKLKPVESRTASRWELARIPASAKPLLRRLGLDINDVAKTGYEEYRALITRIALDPKTRLTAERQRIILGRLEGKKLKRIAEESGRGITKQAINNQESQAIEKIKQHWRG